MDFHIALSVLFDKYPINKSYLYKYMIELNIPNPFAAGKRLTDPKYFAGRDSLLAESVRLLQLGKHLFITGERGVGKSSFLGQLENIFSGDDEARIRFSIVQIQGVRLFTSITCDGSEDPNRLIQRIGTNLSEGLNQSLKRKESFDKITFSLKVFSSESSTRSEPTFSTAAIDDLLLFIRDLRGKIPAFLESGIVISIDEADILPNIDAVAKLIKSIIDSLQSVGIFNVQFIFAGLESTLDKLYFGHPSLARFFRLIKVPAMTPAEIRELCTRALSNQSYVFFNSTVIARIAELAGGYPHAAHVIGEALYDQGLRELKWRRRKGGPRVVNVLKSPKSDDLPAFEGNSGKHICTLVMLDSIILELADQFRGTEYAAIRILMQDARAELALIALANLERLQFGQQAAALACEMSNVETTDLLRRFCVAGVLESLPVQQFRFREPMFHCRLRLLSEANRLAALAFKAKQSNQELFEKSETQTYSEEQKKMIAALESENLLFLYRKRQMDDEC